MRTIALVPEVPVTGRVLDPAGKPLAKVTVTLRTFDPSRSLYATEAELPDQRFRDVQTDEAGRFTIRGASPGRVYRLAVVHLNGGLDRTERFVEGGAPPIDVRLPGRGNLEVDFMATVDVSPAVRERLSDVTLEWQDANGGPWSRYYPGSGSLSPLSGRMHVGFSDLRSGIVRIITPYAGEIAGDVSEPIAVVANTRNRASMRLVPAREVRLRVLDDDNQPVTDARMSVSEGRVPRFVPLDADGWATIAVHPSREATVTVHRPGYFDATAVIAPGAQDPPPLVLRPIR